MSESGQRKTWLWAVLAWFCVMDVGNAAHAAAAVRVVCVDPHDRELRARIEGQTRDLPVELSWVDETIALNPEAEALQRFADRYPGDLVFAVQPSAAGGLTVYVYDVAERQRRVREAPRPTGVERLATSTLAETAALIVRGEVAAVLSARASTQQAADQAAPTPNAPLPPSAAPQPEPPRPAQAPAAANTDGEPRLSKLGLVLAAGIRAGLPGSGALLAGPWLGAHLAVSRLEIGLIASTTLPVELQRGMVRISLRQHSLRLEAHGRVALATRLELVVGVGTGVLAYARETHLLAQGSLMTTPDATAWSITFGPLAEVRWRLLPRVGLAVRLGVDVNPQPTRFVYRQAGTRLAVGELAFFEPWAAAALFVDIGK